MAPDFRGQKDTSLWHGISYNDSRMWIQNCDNNNKKNNLFINQKKKKNVFDQKSVCSFFLFGFFCFFFQNFLRKDCVMTQGGTSQKNQPCAPWSKKFYWYIYLLSTQIVASSSLPEFGFFPIREISWPLINDFFFFLFLLKPFLSTTVKKNWTPNPMISKNQPKKSSVPKNFNRTGSPGWIQF